MSEKGVGLNILGDGPDGLRINSNFHGLGSSMIPTHGYQTEIEPCLGSEPSKNLTHRPYENRK